MDEFTEEDLQLSIESEDDTRLTLTLVSVNGRKITQAEFIYQLRAYLEECDEAERERKNSGAIIQ